MTPTVVPGHEHTFELGGPGVPVVSADDTDFQALKTEPPAQAALFAPPPSLPGRPAAAAPLSAKPPTGRELVRQLRARLRDVKRELKAKKALERERDQLQRLITAATTELDNVRRLRAAG